VDNYDGSMASLHPLSTLATREPDPLRRALRAQAREIVAREPGTRLGSDPEELHKQRVATRRLRSLLRSTRERIEDLNRGARLESELRWLGGVLGEVRDRDVLSSHLIGGLGTIEEGASFGGILELLDGEREEARRALIDALDSTRYATLLAEFDSPPALREGERFATAVAAEYERLRKAAKRLGTDSSDAELHRVRIRAKRSRYAAEALGGEPRFVARAKLLQDVLGEHQDAVVAEKRIRELIAAVRGTGRTALVAGRLIERQRRRRIEAREAWPKAWARLRRAGDDAWR